MSRLLDRAPAALLRALITFLLALGLGMPPLVSAGLPFLLARYALLCAGTALLCALFSLRRGALPVLLLALAASQGVLYFLGGGFFRSGLVKISLSVLQNELVETARAIGIAFEHVARMRVFKAVENGRRRVGRINIVKFFRAKLLKSLAQRRAMARPDERILAAVRRDRRNRIVRGKIRQRRNRIDQRFGALVRILDVFGGKLVGGFIIHERGNGRHRLGRQNRLPRLGVEIDRSDARRDKDDRKRRRFTARIRVKRDNVPACGIAAKRDAVELDSALGSRLLEFRKRRVYLVENLKNRVRTRRLLFTERIADRSGDVACLRHAAREPLHIGTLAAYPRAPVNVHKRRAGFLRREFVREIEVDLIPILFSVRNVFDRDAVDAFRPIFKVARIVKRLLNLERGVRAASGDGCDHCRDRPQKKTNPAQLAAFAAGRGNGTKFGVLRRHIKLPSRRLASKV